MASKADRKLPFTPRSASWVSSIPSTLTLTLRMPASFAAITRSRVRPRPPVVMVQSIPWARTARAMVVQSSRR